MTHNPFDMGRRAGPDFVLPPQAPAVESEPAAPPASQGRPRRGGRTAILLSACVISGAAGGVGASWVTAGGSSAILVQQRPAASDPGSVPDAQSAAAALLPTVVEVSAGSSRGSGFVIDDQGRIMTNSHVVQGYSRVLVRLADGSRTAARVVGTDPATDIAVLEIAGDPPPSAALGTSASLRIGQPVIAVGAPLGLSSTVTAGIVSATDRSARLPGGLPDMEMVQTDASINPGNSGGPLANFQGQVIGMNTAIATVGGPEAGNIGIGFAVPIDRAVAVARDIIAND